VGDQNFKINKSKINKNNLLLLWQLQEEEIELLVCSKKHPQKNSNKTRKNLESLKHWGSLKKKREKKEKKKMGSKVRGMLLGQKEMGASILLNIKFICFL
jgi:hypothetical protein